MQPTVRSFEPEKRSAVKIMDQRTKGACEREHTGVEAIDSGLGLNINALTSNLFAEAFPSAGGGLEGFPLNGGMVWMIIFCHSIGAFGLVADFMGVGRTTFGGRGLFVVCLMARAFSETASDLVFSRICFCFSSSLVKMGTRSSGIGFLSCDRRFDQCDLIPREKGGDAEPTLND